VKIGKDGWEGTPAKFFKPDLQKRVNAAVGGQHGDLLLFAAAPFALATEGLGHLRLHLGQKLGLIKDGTYAFAWVTDMPLFEPRPEGGWQAAHHVFTMPLEEDMKYLESDPARVRAKRYDLAMNGVEIAGGSIRIHRKEVQEQVLKVAGISMDEVRRKFGFLLDAFKYGAPPHGGIAFGFDRLVTLLGGALDIREFIAFPKNKAAQGMMEGSPSDVSDAQLKELHLRLDVAKAVKK
jgi:aspartyl-tRNA synthetase